MIRSAPTMVIRSILFLICLSAATEAFISSVPGHRRIQQRATSWAIFASSSDDFDDLADLWSMEDDDDDDTFFNPITFTRSPPEREPPVAALKVTPAPPKSKKVGDFDDMANLWSREEEDDEDDGGWPGAMNEIQRLKEIARKQLEEPAIKPPPPPSVAAAELKASTTGSASGDNFEDLASLWDMEDDGGEDNEDEVVWMDESEEVKSPLDSTLEAKVEAPIPVEPATASPAPPQPISELTNGSGDLASLWSREDDDDDDEGWPDATDKAQRLKLLERQKRAEEAANPPGKKIQRPTRHRTVRRKPPFWEVRLRLIREYQAEHGHIDIPYRYEVHLEEGDDYHDKEASAVKLGYFLYWLRSLFDEEHLQATAPFDFVKELTDLGMKWKFLGKGRRQQLFLQHLNEWRNANNSEEGTTTMDPTLRTWMWRQRYQYARQCEGLPSTLTPERVNALVDAHIIPFQRPLRMMQDRWDKEWQANFEKWKANANDPESTSSDTLMLWEWDQWRMFDILRGDIPYKGDLPVLLTGLRVMQLQEVNFFESSRPTTAAMQPPDVVATNHLSADWNDVVSTIREYYFNHGDFDIKRSCPDFVGDESLYGISSRLQREYQKWIIQKQGNVEDATSMTLNNDEHVKDLTDVNFFQATTKDAGGDPIQLEYKWWEQYYDFKSVRRDYLLGNHVFSTVTSWMEEQQERVNRMLLPPSEGEGTALKESHYEALTNLGIVFEFPAQDAFPAGRSAVGNVVGRPPSVMKLNDDVLPSEQLQRSQSAEVVEDMAWTLRYDELRAFVELTGHSVKPRLSLWANNQRLQYQKYLVNNGETSPTIPLDEQRVKLLKEINFDFGAAVVGDGVIRGGADAVDWCCAPPDDFSAVKREAKYSSLSSSLVVFSSLLLAAVAVVLVVASGNVQEEHGGDADGDDNALSSWAVIAAV